jgi:hypothetical protein
MATTNTTSGTQAAIAKPLPPGAGVDPNQINTLIQIDYRDTIIEVNSVLAFLAGWAENASDDDVTFSMTGAGNGLCRILQSCQAALNYHSLHDPYGQVGG